ncbi:MAG: ABC transporter substrate-binding protein [Chloroflexi bacterium]|nr:ABC transporter substrate-binding protein [Chloroflexota bacterium]MDK1045125.1 ABC transporter substrate-binding protein [Anaerolineales bacterium]MCI0773088.1 ABC transporter substrate-binding protein [Chloroflexota bacterium]MCI0805407.1 ABC transporter substrate-binding protein [Chloroflexota bacterium]MCI0827008.1 ABC transporter substrate-binding protein [Chloroflexota bacterium]
MKMSIFGFRPTSLSMVIAASLTLAACASAAPEPVGVIRVGMQPMVQTDPAFISSDTEVLFANHVYDYLVDVNPQNQVVPRLAAEWSVSDDGLIYTFTLAEGVKFHDGTSLTPEDVVWTLDRLRDQDVGSPAADLYGNIEAIQAIGDNQVRINLDQPNPFFLYDLSDNHALILKANTPDPATAFNGTGPFKVESYSPEDRIVLTANEDYFVEGAPGLAGMEIIFFNEDSAMADALRGGQIDLMMRMSTALFESLKVAPGIETYDIPTNGFDLVRLRSDRAPGNDPRVVQAFKLATDRAEIFELIQQGYGAVGRDSPIGPLYVDYYSEEEQIPARDVEAARALLAEAGYEDGLQMELHTPDTGGRPDLGAVLKEQWREAGIEVEIIVEPESVYYGADGWLEVDLGITGWGSRPIPQFYLDVMLKCGAKWNESHFCDQEFDDLVDIAGSTLDEDVRKAAYRDIQRILIERGPVIIPYYFAQFAAIREGYEGFELKAFAGRTDLSQVSLSQ